MSVKLALIGKNIAHSKSPELQQEIWQDELVAYDLIEVQEAQYLPSLQVLSQQYLGINITTPYKESYFSQVRVESEIAQALGAINTIALIDQSATNTDALAVEKILTDYQKQLGNFTIHLLGAGVMARMTMLIADKMGIKVVGHERKSHGDLSKLDLSGLDSKDLVINACSRNFIFTGPISSACHFWDYNYAFLPHYYLQHKVKTYQDGQELLRQQAICAADFWRQKSKLND